MFVTSGFPPATTDETSKLPRSNHRKYFSFIKVWIEDNQGKEARQQANLVDRNFPKKLQCESL
jgi:hypothetical protein